MTVAFPWYGGKDRLAPKIAAHLPARSERPILVEVFGGSAALTLSLDTPWPREVVNDLDDGVVGFYVALRDHREEFVRRLRLTPYSRAEWRLCASTWSDQTDPIERARRWYVVAGQSFSGSFGASWSHSTRSADGFASHPWVAAVDRLDAFAERMRRWQIDKQDWRVLLDAYDGPETVFYLDPPYHHETRTRPMGYRHEMSASDHADLVARIQSLRGAVLLSGYAHPTYDGPLSAWRRIEWDRPAYSQPRASGDTKAVRGRRTEVLWISPNVRSRQMTLGVG